MKVAINALPFRSTHHGVGRYVRNLLSSLLDIDSCTKYVVYASRLGARQLVDTQSANLEIRTVDFPRPIRVVWEHVVLPKLLAREQIDVYFGISHVLPLRAATAQVVTVHDLSWFVCPQMHEQTKVLYFRWLIPRSLRRADRIFVDSAATRDDVMRLVGIPQNRITVALLGVESRFQPQSEDVIRSAWGIMGIPRPYLLHMAVREPRKNLQGVLRAYIEILSHRPDFPCDLVVAGEASYGWKNHEAQRLLRDPRIVDRIRVIGAIPDHLLPAILSGATVFVLPSFYEGFGLPVLEAMASGTAVVTSRVSALPEVCGDAACYVADPEDSSSIATAIELVVDDETLRRSLVSRGLSRASQFTWHRCARETLSGLMSVMNRRMEMKPIQASEESIG
jgi:glycosyltransferase involved in cell wall biosynthesis